MEKLALVTGANRGLGFETCRQLAARGLEVILTSRNPAEGMKAAEKIGKDGGTAHFHQLDVTDPASVQALAQHVAARFGRLDVLVNNAGVFLDADDPENESASAFKTKIETVKATLEANVYGPLMLCQAFIPLMVKNNYGRVVNLSSGMGQLSEMNGGYTAYRLSKAAINVLTRVFNDETQGSNVLINSVCPGWVKTEMGGPGAALEIKEGVDTIVWLATMDDNGPRGGFFRERELIDW